MAENRKLKYLFVCFAGVNRSPTAVHVAKKMAFKKGIELEADFFGIITFNGQSKTSVREKCESYDRVFVMEDYIKKKLVEEYYVDPKKIHCFGIEDNYRIKRESDRILLEATLEQELDKWVR